jgi:hypothetical protein
MWTEFEWENRVNVSTPVTYVGQVASLNSVDIRPAIFANIYSIL